LYLYLAKEGIKINARPPIPNTIPIEAPGQCIIIKRRPNRVKEENNAPEKNTRFFILSRF
jgi:hypothetical protein